MADQIQWRRNTAAAAAASNPTLAEGEVGYETDTRKCKVGDGTTAWNSLEYSIFDDAQVVVLIAAAAATGTGNLVRASGATVSNVTATGTVTVPDASFTIAKTTGLQTALTSGLARANHTGTQAQSTVTNLVTDLAAKKTDSMTTGKILGRSTASTGAIEEIAVGTGLNLAAGVLTSSGGDGTTDLVATPTATTVVVESSTGADATVPAASGTLAGVMLPAEKTRITSAALTALASKTVPAGATLADTSTAQTFSSKTLASPVVTGGITLPDGSLAIADTSGLQTALDSKTPNTGTKTIAGPTAFTTAPTSVPAVADTELVQLEQLNEAVEGRALENHTHVLADITDYLGRAIQFLIQDATTGDYADPTTGGLRDATVPFAMWIGVDPPPSGVGGLLDADLYLPLAINPAMT